MSQGLRLIHVQESRYHKCDLIGGEEPGVGDAGVTRKQTTQILTETGKQNQKWRGKKRKVLWRETSQD